MRDAAGDNSAFVRFCFAVDAHARIAVRRKIGLIHRTSRTSIDFWIAFTNVIVGCRIILQATDPLLLGRQTLLPS